MRRRVKTFRIVNIIRMWLSSELLVDNRQTAPSIHVEQHAVQSHLLIQKARKTHEI